MGFSQIFPADQAPPSVNWKQLNTKDFQLIFPEVLHEEALQVSVTLSYYIAHIQRDLQIQPRKISIILDNLGIESNGFVQLAPRKSEFYATPPQKTYAQKWLDQLAIHEYRHVVQFAKLTDKLRAPLELLGLAFYGVTLPPWFYEGDAVFTETILSQSGRGRLPSWEMPLRTNLLNGRTLTYQENYLGSLKKITSGYYELGYFMVSYLRKNNGDESIDSLLNGIKKKPLKPYNLSQNIKALTGYNTRQLHDLVMQDLKQQWQTQFDKIQALAYPIYPIPTKDSTDQIHLPQATQDGALLSLHQTRHSVSSIQIFKQGKSKRLPIKLGVQTSPYFHYGGGKITWDEIRIHPRYHKRQYSVINTYDLATKKQKQLTFKSRLLSPTLSADGHLIAAVHINQKNAFFIVFLDAESGQEIQRIPAPKNIELQRPSFSPDANRIVCTFVGKDGAGIMEFNRTLGTYDLLLEKQHQQISTAVYADQKHLIFKGHYNGIDNLYLLDFDSTEIYQITQAPYGAFNPSYDSELNQLWFNYYTPNGFRVSSIDLPPSYQETVKNLKNTFIAYFKAAEAPNHIIDNTSLSLPKKSDIRPYKGFKRLFNFHSLSLGSDNFRDLNQIRPEIILLSDNLLNTMQTRMGVAYNSELRKPEYHMEVRYKKWLPVIGLGYQNTAQRQIVRTTSDEKNGTELQWRQGRFALDIGIPLSFNHRNQNYQFGLQASTSYTHRYNLKQQHLSQNFIRSLAFPIQYHLYFGRNKIRSAWDIAPLWGQTFHVYYGHMPFEGSGTDKFLAITSNLYFPGILRNHSLQVRFNYQEVSGQFQYASIIPKVSGYGQIAATQPENTLLLNYKFPIAYPDLELGNLAYLRRLRAGFFADFENISQKHVNRPRTMGAELHTDLNLLRFYLPVFDLGVKAIYVNEPWHKKWLFQFGLSYSY